MWSPEGRRNLGMTVNESGLEQTGLAGLLPALHERLPALLEEVTQRLRTEWPDYAAFLADNREEVAAAADLALLRFAFGTVIIPPQRAEEPDDPARRSAEQELFEEVGRVQWREGRDVSTLLSALHLGARIFWRHVADVAVELRLDPRTTARLAEGVFAFVDRLSSSSAHGYVQEQSEAGAARQRLREELVELLLSDRATDAAVRVAADRAGWRVPVEVAVVLVQGEEALGRSVLGRLDPGALVFERDGVSGAVLPDPSASGRRARLRQLLHGTGAVVGAAVPPERLPASLQIASVAARLQRTGVLCDDPVFADEHLDAIIVHRDSKLLEVLRTQVLRPLDGSAPASRERLCETLVAWLRHMGDRQTMAAELHVHPQTVRYRMARLHELFGRQLDDPAGRARLLLALTWGAPQTAELSALRGDD